MRRRPSRALLRGEVRTSPKPAFFKQIGGGESLATTADWKPPMRCTILVLKSNETLQLSKYRRDGNALVFEQLDGTNAFPSLRYLLSCKVSLDRKSTRLNSSHTVISYAVFCLKKKKQK